MSNATLALIGWGFFYWVVFLYLFWVLVERTFSVATDPKRFEQRTPEGTAGSTTRDPHPTPHVPHISVSVPPA